MALGKVAYSLLSLSLIVKWRDDQWSDCHVHVLDYAERIEYFLSANWRTAGRIGDRDMGERRR